eukprot:1156745-Pelagomonas_calceolata.AAC.15
MAYCVHMRNWQLQNPRKTHPWGRKLASPFPRWCCFTSSSLNRRPSKGANVPTELREPAKDPRHPELGGHPCTPDSWQSQFEVLEDKFFWFFWRVWALKDFVWLMEHGSKYA